MNSNFANLPASTASTWLRRFALWGLVAGIGLSLAWLPEIGAIPIASSAGNSYAAETSEPAQPPPLGDPDASPESANQLVLRAAQHLTQHYSISAKIRQRVEMFDQVILGTGEFWQLNLGGTTYVRYDIELPLEGGAARILQVNDGRFLWKRSTVPTPYDSQRTQTSLRRINVQSVSRSLDRYPEHLAARELRGVAGQGGLAEVLIDLYRNFDFQTAYRGNLHGVPVWIMTGRRPVRPSMAVADGNAASPLAGPHQPDSVTLAVGQEDLFPYRIEFQQDIAEEASQQFAFAEKSKTHTIVLLELYEVTLNSALDPRSKFSYQPDDVQLVDVTDDYLRKLLLLE